MKKLLSKILLFIFCFIVPNHFISMEAATQHFIPTLQMDGYIPLGSGPSQAASIALDWALFHLREQEVNAPFFNNPLCEGLTAKDFILQHTEGPNIYAGTHFYVAQREVKGDHLHRGIQITIPLKCSDGMYTPNGDCNWVLREEGTPLDQFTLNIGANKETPNPAPSPNSEQKKSSDRKQGKKKSSSEETFEWLRGLVSRINHPNIVSPSFAEQLEKIERQRKKAQQEWINLAKTPEAKNFTQLLAAASEAWRKEHPGISYLDGDKPLEEQEQRKNMIAKGVWAKYEELKALQDAPKLAAKRNLEEAERNLKKLLAEADEAAKTKAAADAETAKAATDEAKKEATDKAKTKDAEKTKVEEGGSAAPTKAEKKAAAAPSVIDRCVKAGKRVVARTVVRTAEEVGRQLFTLPFSSVHKRQREPDPFTQSKFHQSMNPDFSVPFIPNPEHQDLSYLTATEPLPMEQFSQPPQFSGFPPQPQVPPQPNPFAGQTQPIPSQPVSSQPIIFSNAQPVTAHSGIVMDDRSPAPVSLIDAPIATACNGGQVSAVAIETSISRIESIVDSFMQETGHPAVQGVQTTLGSIHQLATVFADEGDTQTGALLASLAKNLAKTTKDFVNELRQTKFAQGAAAEASERVDRRLHPVQTFTQSIKTFGELLLTMVSFSDDDDSFRGPDQRVLEQRAAIGQAIAQRLRDSSWGDVQYQSGKIVTSVVLDILEGRVIGWATDKLAQVRSLLKEFRSVIANPHSLAIINQTTEPVAATLKIVATEGKDVAERVVGVIKNNPGIIDSKGSVSQALNAVVEIEKEIAPKTSLQKIIDLVKQSQPGPGNSTEFQRYAVIGNDEGRIVFRRDIGQRAHQISRGGPCVNHYNIEIYDAIRNGSNIEYKRMRNFHITLNESMEVIDIF